MKMRKIHTTYYDFTEIITIFLIVIIHENKKSLNYRQCMRQESEDKNAIFAVVQTCDN